MTSRRPSASDSALPFSEDAADERLVASPLSAAEALAATAADWLVRRQAEDWSPEDEAAWRRWRSAGPSHEAAATRAERLWTELRDLKQAPDLVATLATTETRTLPTPRPPRRRPPVLRHVLGAGGLMLMAVIAVFTATGGEPMLALQADARTAVGETRHLGLSDGSRIHLFAGSAIAVHYTETERRVELLRGEALFEARPVDLAAAATSAASATSGAVVPEHRPFIVTAAAGSTRALGTRFIVERLATHTRVVGVEHQVAVSVAQAPQAAKTLSPGQAVRYDETGVGEVEAASPQWLAAEAQGQLVFERTRLIDAVQRLNRHYAGHIAVRGEAVAQREVSGVFPAADVEGAIASLQSELGLKVLRLPGVVVLY